MLDLIYLKAALMGIVEGLTEFLPISSTGHLILVGGLIDFTGEKEKVFGIAIQTGAMLAVIWQYRVKLIHTIVGMFSDPVAQRFVRNILIAFIPAVVLGLAFGSMIKAHLFSAVPVALAFIIGGFIILIVEKRGETKGHVRVNHVDDMTAKDALYLGLLQCLALIPGTSRSGSTIIGGMAIGLSRKCATEFSFFLGIPTLIGAGAYSIWQERNILQASDTPLFLVGLVFAFVSALICIRWLIHYVSSNSFKPFAWYRIAFGIIVLLTSWTGIINWTA
ncbi:undecaprenyl-diphosphate phosphatase [Klebsiella sp. BIGb0407]|uniref:undecaprenyl-diphosphate phosphatase n=1 Tax=Klebsiella sp. BIGb0407 TaxID=2940603 RepID=UPI0021681FB6|nr:undecaprenyl-diphosphate phosphatase [Klebsiella sp. BIGb0407]MCS3429917.1 undecaprenyl-diphosphatase [Klebsiella sp. BIGb0407]